MKKESRKNLKNEGKFKIIKKPSGLLERKNNKERIVTKITLVISVIITIAKMISILMNKNNNEYNTHELT